MSNCPPVSKPPPTPRAAPRGTSRELALIAELAAANVDAVHLARDLMVAQEAADDLEHAAGRAIDHAAACPDDADAADMAVATVVAADEAGNAELVASIHWQGHVARVERLVDAARLCQAAARRCRSA